MAGFKGLIRGSSRYKMAHFFTKMAPKTVLRSCISKWKWAQGLIWQMQVRRDDQSRCPPNSRVASLAVDSRKETSIEVFHLFRWYTHTYTRAHTEKLHRQVFTHKSFCAQELLTHTEALDTDAFTQRSFYTERLLHTEPFIHRCSYTQAQAPVRQEAFVKKLLHRQALFHT